MTAQSFYTCRDAFNDRDPEAGQWTEVYTDDVHEVIVEGIAAGEVVCVTRFGKIIRFPDTTEFRAAVLDV